MLCRTVMTGETTVLPCAHFFCSDCTSTVLSAPQPTCPMCRSKVRGTQKCHPPTIHRQALPQLPGVSV